MAIGILALIIGSVMLAISMSGIRGVEPTVKADREVRFPYPEEI